MPHAHHSSPPISSASVRRWVGLICAPPPNPAAKYMPESQCAELMVICEAEMYLDVLFGGHPCVQAATVGALPALKGASSPPPDAASGREARASSAPSNRTSMRPRSIDTPSGRFDSFALMVLAGTLNRIPRTPTGETVGRDDTPRRAGRRSPCGCWRSPRPASRRRAGRGSSGSGVRSCRCPAVPCTGSTKRSSRGALRLDGGQRRAALISDNYFLPVAETAIGRPASRGVARRGD